MKYEYYYQLVGKEPQKTTRKGLINVLNQWCTKQVCVVGGFGVDMTDEKKVNKTLRSITVGGCRAYIFYEGMVWAKKIA